MEKNRSYIGVDLGGSNMRAGVVTDGVITKRTTASTPQHTQSSKEAIDALTEVIARVFDHTIVAIGIGVPSVVDRSKGIVYNVANIPHWDEVHLKEILEKRFSVPVYVDNDANCFALGERSFGQGRAFDNFVGLTIGTGLGGGIIQQGKLLADANCGSGEFGMLPYKDAILEYYASGSFFTNVWGVNGQEMYQRAINHDAEALEAYRQLGVHLAVAVKLVMLTVDPQMIVFGGSVATAHPLFEASMHEELKHFEFPNSVKRLTLCYSTLENPGVLGAVSLCY